MPLFDYDPSLQEYAVSRDNFLSQHGDIHMICTGAVVFNNASKLLLVQRAKEELAFANAWVSSHSRPLPDELMMRFSHMPRKYLVGRWMTQTRPSCTLLHVN
jgi:isopentenyldiphosphate isomerase